MPQESAPQLRLIPDPGVTAAQARPSPCWLVATFARGCQHHVIQPLVQLWLLRRCAVGPGKLLRQGPGSCAVPSPHPFSDEECGLSLPGSGTKSLTLGTGANLAEASGGAKGCDADLGVLTISSESFTSERKN